METSEVNNTPDTFTLLDRRELMRQGMQLDKLEQDIMDVKVLVNETFRSSDYERRLRSLEDNQLAVKTVMENREKAERKAIAIASIVATLITCLLEIIMKWKS